MGFATPESLAVVAEVWRPFVIEDGTAWGAIHRQNAETLNALERRGLLKGSEGVERVLDRWTFPLYPLELQADGTKVQDLIKHRRKLEDAWERGVYGVPEGY